MVEELVEEEKEEWREKRWTIWLILLDIWRGSLEADEEVERESIEEWLIEMEELAEVEVVEEVKVVEVEVPEEERE